MEQHKKINKNLILTEAAKKLKEECNAKYKEDIPENDSTKWNEFWKFCSISKTTPNGWPTLVATE